MQMSLPSTCFGICTILNRLVCMMLLCLIHAPGKACCNERLSEPSSPEGSTQVSSNTPLRARSTRSTCKYRNRYATGSLALQQLKQNQLHHGMLGVVVPPHNKRMRACSKITPHLYTQLELTGSSSNLCWIMTPGCSAEQLQNMPVTPCIGPTHTSSVKGGVFATSVAAWACSASS